MICKLEALLTEATGIMFLVVIRNVPVGRMMLNKTKQNTLLVGTFVQNGLEA